MEPKDAKRVIDFVVGVAYAINGDVQKVRDEIFICSPANFQVQEMFFDVLSFKGGILWQMNLFQGLHL